MTVLLIHGFNATPDQHWYKSLRPLLEMSGVQYLSPALPDSGRPQKQSWLATIKQSFDQINDEVILVGHSLGTRATLLFLEQYEVQVRASLLVGAFSNNLDNGLRRGSVYASFFDHPIDLSLIKTRCPKFVVMHSRDDQSIPYAQGAQIALDLGAEMVTEDGHGHFTDADDASIISAQILRINNG